MGFGRWKEKEIEFSQKGKKYILPLIDSSILVMLLLVFCCIVSKRIG